MKKFLCLVDEIYEDLELWYPKIRLEEAGCKVLLVGPKEGHIYTGKHGYPCQSDLALDAVRSSDYDGLIIPGGYAPDKLRRLEKVLSITAEMNAAGKPIAFICHGGWVPISAKILKGRQVTSARAIKDDMENAGAHWIDQALVVDRNLISSRSPADLPLFGKELVSRL